MSYPAYEEYKDSGVDWLELVPSHWGVVETRRVTRRVRRNVRDSDGIVTAFRDGQVTLRSNRRTDGFTNAIKEIGYQGIREGDLVIHAMDGFAGAIGVSDSDGKSSPVVHAYRSESMELRYVAYLLRVAAWGGYVQSLAKGIRERSSAFDQAAFGAMKITFPPLAEQKQIADFLDRETKQIDNLIAEQEALVENLTERRKAVISHAVTRGLNPEADLTDSGVEWLGRVVSDWTIDKLGRHTRIGNGSTPHRENESYWQSGTIPWLNSSCVNRDEVDSVEFHVTERAVAECHLPLVLPGSILVGLTGQGKTRGKATLLAIESTINQHVAYVAPKCENWNPNYLVAALRAAYAHLRATSDENGSTKGGLTCARLSQTMLPMPPLVEQAEIAAYLDDKTSKLDALITEAKALIDLLKERRSALISAAVTGKIDVRSEALARG